VSRPDILADIDEDGELALDFVLSRHAIGGAAKQGITGRNSLATNHNTWKRR